MNKPLLFILMRWVMGSNGFTCETYHIAANDENQALEVIQDHVEAGLFSTYGRFFLTKEEYLRENSTPAINRSGGSEHGLNDFAFENWLKINRKNFKEITFN